MATTEYEIGACAGRGQNDRGGLFQCVTAERAFLRAMGGGCQSPVAAFARLDGTEIELRAVSFLEQLARRGQRRAAVKDAAALGRAVASELR